jgi:hypothetical protein
MSDERNEPDVCESAHLALTMTQCASKSGFKPSRSKLLCTRYLSISVILLALFLTRFTKILSGRAWRLKFGPDEFSKRFATGKQDVFRPQTDQLIEPYLSKPLEKQDAVEGTRFKTKIFIETALIGRGNDLARNDKLRLF